MKEVKSGIYQWRNLIDQKVYIGSSIDFDKRISLHLSKLRSNTHHSIHFQRAWNKYGEENFKFEILELVSRNQDEKFLDFEKRLCKGREQFYLDQYGAQDFINKKSNEFIERTYNINPIAGSSRGRVLQNYVVWNKGIPHSRSHKDNLKLAWRRRKETHKASKETLRKRSDSIKIARSRDEVREKYKVAILNRPLLTCPHCGYEGKNKGSMSRVHFDRCKNKTE